MGAPSLFQNANIFAITDHVLEAPIYWWILPVAPICYEK
jgi:hypothetical protein